MIDTIDEWVLGKHQAVADWAYTKWDVSPYWLAAQLFGLNSLLLILILAVRTIWLTPDWTILIETMMLAFAGVYYSVALRSDARWRSGRLPDRPNYPAGHRLIWLFLTATASIAAIPLSLDRDPAEVRNILYFLYEAAMAAALYFESCHPPTLRQDWRTELSPSPAARLVRAMFSLYATGGAHACASFAFRRTP